MNIRTHVIGFGHRARRGKDTCVQSIIEAFGSQYTIKRYSFGTALKVEVNDLFDLYRDWRAVFDHCYRLGMPKDIVPEESPDFTDPDSPYGKQRKLLQWYGTEYRRSEDPSYWVRPVERLIYTEQPQIALISDLRFPNEFWWIQDHMKGDTIRVERTGYEKEEGQSGHESEHALDNFRYRMTITAGDGQLDHLRQCAREAFQQILDRLAVPDLPNAIYVKPRNTRGTRTA